MPLKYILPLFLLLSSSLFPQFKYQLYTEAGYFDINDDNALNSDKILTRLNGEVKYDYKEQNRTGSVSLNLRPEFYGFTNFQSIYKAKATAEYFQRDDLLGWGLNISRQRNVYNSSLRAYNYDMFFLTGQTEWNVIENIPVQLNLGYSYQETDNTINQYYDLYFVDVKAFSTLLDKFNVGYGVYAERFNIINKLPLPDILHIDADNSGYRWGPQVSFNYIHDFMFNAEYNFFVHNSDVTESFSFEQLIRVVAGVIFEDDFSVFLFVDYYKRNLKVKADYSEGITPLYVPLNLENRIYLKFGYDVSLITEVYVKGGYLKENLYNTDYSFSGWHLLAGFQIGN